jgi:hypothetical protein
MLASSYYTFRCAYALSSSTSDMTITYNASFMVGLFVGGSGQTGNYREVADHLYGRVWIRSHSKRCKIIWSLNYFLDSTFVCFVLGRVQSCRTFSRAISAELHQASGFILLRIAALICGDADQATRKQQIMDGLRNEMALANAQELINVCSSLKLCIICNLFYDRKSMKNASPNASPSHPHRWVAPRRPAYRAVWKGTWRPVSQRAYLSKYVI